MRVVSHLALPALLSLAIGHSALAAPQPTEEPKRMAGLWLLNTLPQSPAAEALSYHLCVDPAADQLLNRPDNLLTNCKDAMWAKDDHYTYYSATCEAKGSTAKIFGRFTGDFKYNYHGELSTTFTPELDGVKVATLEVDGRRLAPCKAEHPKGKFLIKGQDGVGNLNIGEPIKR